MSRWTYKQMNWCSCLCWCWCWADEMMLMLMLWPQAVTPGVTHSAAYHRPSDGNFLLWCIVIFQVQYNQPSSVQSTQFSTINSSSVQSTFQFSTINWAGRTCLLELLPQQPFWDRFRVVPNLKPVSATELYSISLSNLVIASKNNATHSTERVTEYSC